MSTSSIFLQAFLEAGLLASAILVMLGGVALVPRRIRTAINNVFHKGGF